MGRHPKERLARPSPAVTPEGFFVRFADHDSPQMSLDLGGGSSTPTRSGGDGSGRTSHRAAAAPRPRRRRGSLMMAATAVGATVVATLAGVTPVVAGAAMDAGRAITHHHATSSHPSAASSVQAGRSVPGGLPTAKPVAPVTTPGTAPAGGSTPVTAGLKAPMSGLLDRHHAPTTGFTSLIHGYVVDVAWASLQPTQGGALVHPNAIDTAIAYAKAHNMALKLRVAAGTGAPAWAKSLDGAPIPVKYTAATKGKAGVVAGTIGRFWLPKFGAAYQDLQNKLAAAYDDVPQIRETDVTRCATIFEETYLRNTKLAENATTLLRAGFTRALDDVCHNQQIQAHTVWKHTRSDVSFNTYQAIASDGSVKGDLTYTLSQMDYCRQILGARCVLSNHSLSSTRLADKDMIAIYGKMKAMAASGPFALQTATAAKIGDWNKAITWAVTSGASSIELPTGYTSWSLSTLNAIQGKF